MTRSRGVPLRGLGFGVAMACTNRFGWPGYRWGGGPDWATTGMIRPVTEIQRSVPVTVNDFPAEGAHEVFVDATFADQPLNTLDTQQLTTPNWPSAPSVKAGCG